MGIKEREWKDSSFSYRFGFNGYEQDDEVAGQGSVIDFGARIYDSRLGRFFSVDPIVYPYWSPYQYDGNSPISIKDILGMGIGDGQGGTAEHGESRVVDGEKEYWDATVRMTDNNGNFYGSGAWVDYSPKTDYKQGSYEAGLIESNDKYATLMRKLHSVSDQLNTLEASLNETDKLLNVSEVSTTPNAMSSTPSPANNAGNYSIEDAKQALQYIYDNYGEEMAIIVERMYRAETRHFKSKQYRLTGSGGMEAHGSAPYYGWNSEVWKTNPDLAPTGTTAMYEGKGLSGQGGNAQVKNKPKQFIIFPSVTAAMIYKAEYINRYNGNYARWFSTDPNRQALYRKAQEAIRPRIVNSIKNAQ